MQRHDHPEGRVPSSAEAGFTFAELAFGLIIFLISAVVLINHLTVNYQTTRSERDRVFAFSRAQSILSEIQTFVDTTSTSAAADLDQLDDGAVTRPTLSIVESAPGSLILPDHPLSNNSRVGATWQWSRRISVQPFSGLNNRNVRYVTVRIFKRDRNGVEQGIADLSSVVNSAGSAYPTTQVFDVFGLAVENIPGWWVYMDAIRPFVESTMTDLETRNPGLVVRTHWITKASYGRNPVYTPMINETVDSRAPVNGVYWYPGLMPAGSASKYYYVAANMKARVNVDGVQTNGFDANLNPFPYTLADFYNHGMRYPQELRLHEQRVAEVQARENAILAAQIAGTAPPAPLDDMSKEPTYRLFLEDLCSNPDKYENALIINLHGELMPTPSIRNYSDAAKVPSDPTLANIRVVTHPEELRATRGGAEDVRLRVHSYFAQRDAMPAGVPIMPNNHPIVVDVLGMELITPAGVLKPGVSIDYLAGGVSVGGDDSYYPWAPGLRSSVDPNQMYYEAERVDLGDAYATRFKFYNTPFAAPNVGGAGINATSRSELYGLEYVPGFPAGAADRDLDTVGNLPKNTARWLITIPSTSFADNLFVARTIGAGGLPVPDYSTVVDDHVLNVRTRIGDDSLTTDEVNRFGTMYPIGGGVPIQPENLSETYVWWCDSVEDVPYTERAQFQGDPRHNPYRDLLSIAGADFEHGFNWFFDDLRRGGENARGDWPCFATNRLMDRWRNRMHCDVPRLFELVRTGIVRSQCMYTTLTGFSYYYMGIGNEIGYDSANGYPNSIPVDLGPWGAPGAAGFANNITGRRNFIVAHLGGARVWFGAPWLGELYPDEWHDTDWIDGVGNVIGNVGAGSWSAGNAFRFPCQDTMNTFAHLRPYGTEIRHPQQRTAGEGCTSFFNAGTSAATFHHTPNNANGTLTTTGDEIAANYNFPMPNSTLINRPFRTAWGGATGNEFGLTPYSANRYSVSLVKQYYDHPTGAIGSGLVELADPTNTNAAYVVVNGLGQTTLTGTSFIAKYSMLTLVHSMFEAGAGGLTHRIEQPARVEIASPTEITEFILPVTSIPIRYNVEWRRWDGQPYTAITPLAFTENEGSLEYVITYSNDAGTTWRNVVDDSPAILGERPSTAALILDDGGFGEEVYNWDVSDAVKFPEATYYLHVDCYRKGKAMHYSNHQVKIFVDR